MQPKLLISDEKLLMLGELKGCATDLYIFWVFSCVTFNQYVLQILGRGGSEGGGVLEHRLYFSNPVLNGVSILTPKHCFDVNHDKKAMS